VTQRPNDGRPAWAVILSIIVAALVRVAAVVYLLFEAVARLRTEARQRWQLARKRTRKALREFHHRRARRR
jgi:hypothetical protein